MGQFMEVESLKISFLFLNSGFSFNNPSIIINFLQNGLKTLPKRSVPQHFDLGSRLIIETFSQYTKHHSDLLTLKSLNFLPYDFGRILGGGGGGGGGGEGGGK